MLSDILRVLKIFKATDGLSLHVVEVSQHLSSVQSQKLCDDVVAIGMMPRPTDGQHYKTGTTPDNIKVFWYNKIEEIPRNFSVIIAHEFFDALPIHKFQVRITLMI